MQTARDAFFTKTMTIPFLPLLIAVYMILIYGIFRLLRRFRLFKTTQLIHEEVLLRATCVDVMLCMVEVSPTVVWFNG
jgi:hypothetical protein